MASTVLFNAPTLELLAHCQVELDRIQSEIEGLDSVEAQARLARVERALSWLRSGNFGFCGVCGQRIADAALRAAPDRLVCDRCAKPMRAPFSAIETATW